MAPKKPSAKAGTPPPPIAPPSQRGGSGLSNRGSKKKITSDRDGPKKKKNAAKKQAGLEPVAEAGDEAPEASPAAATELESISTLVGPIETILVELREHVMEAQQQLKELRVLVPEEEEAPARVEAAAEATQPEPAAPAKPPDLQKTETFMKKQQHALKIWRKFAAEKLAEMASSLEAALLNDTKLRDLFDHIDTDLGGSIDQDELDIALKGAGKNLPEELLVRMFNAADEDGSGDVDYSEFQDVIRGVKAAKAAFALQRGVRRHQSGQAAARLKQQRALSKEELDKAFGQALLTKTSKQLFSEWDKNKNGTLSRQEFRQGARDRFGLNFDNRDLDEWFDKFDKNADGEIDLAEMRDAMKGLHAARDKEREEAAGLERTIASLEAKMRGLQAHVSATSATVQASLDATDALRAFRAEAAVDALVGERLGSKIKSAKNPKGVLDFEAVVGQWDISREVEGRMNKEEFVAAVLKELGGGVSKAAAVTQQQVEALFDRLDVELQGSVEIRSTLQGFLVAEKERVERAKALTESAAKLKAAALEAQTSVKTVAPEFLRREAEEAAADEKAVTESAGTDAAAAEQPVAEPETVTEAATEAAPAPIDVSDPPVGD